MQDVGSAPIFNEVGALLCLHCKEFRPEAEMRVNRQCKACANKINREWRDRNRETFQLQQRNHAHRRRLRRHGLTPDDYDAMVRAQGGRCAICNEPLHPDCLDHDHQTGKVRGLLCNACNTRLHDGTPRHWYADALAYLDASVTEV